jgi:hypothetical protein
MQKIIQIYPCLLKLSHKQDTILKINDFFNQKLRFPPKILASNTGKYLKQGFWGKILVFG